jgi:hypothetical protein
LLCFEDILLRGMSMTPDKDKAGVTTRREFMQSGVAVAGTLLASQVGSTTASAEAKPERPNLIFFFGEGQRADALSIAGHRILKTPHHDRIGLEGIRFRNAFSQDSTPAPPEPCPMNF